MPTMNRLAEELNEILKDTIVYHILSDVGKNMYFPKGIVAQSGEAKRFANKYNATVGMAYAKGKPMHLNVIGKYFNGLDAEEIFSYASTSGLPELRELWKEEMLSKNPSLKEKSFSNPLVVPGLTNGIVNAADLFLGRDDVVVVPDMFWGNYRLIFEVRKEARVATFPFFKSAGGFNVDAFGEALKANANNGKVLTILNFPNNPTGYTPTEGEVKSIVEKLEELATEGLKIVAITDDAYFGLFYEDGTSRESIFARLADLNSNILAIKVDGATKENLVWGFRIGFLTFASKGLDAKHYEALEKKAMGSIRSSVSNSSKIAQSLLIRAMKDPAYAEEKEKTFETLKARYLKVKEIVNSRDSSKIEPLPFNSGYFMTFRVKNGKAEKLRTYLLHEQGIGTISINDDYLRVAYSSIDLENLEDLYNKIYEAAEEVV